MRITKISVKGLFGMFDHEIPLNQESRITIVHGPNGVGKTVLVRLINALFSCDYDYFIDRVPFEQIRIDFDKGTFIVVEKRCQTYESGYEYCDALEFQFDDGSATQSKFHFRQPEDYEGSQTEEIREFYLENLGIIDSWFERRGIHDYDLWRKDNWLFTSEQLVDLIPGLHDWIYGEMPDWFAEIRRKANVSHILADRTQILTATGWYDDGGDLEEARKRGGIGRKPAVSAISENIKAIARDEPVVTDRERLQAALARVDSRGEDSMLATYLESPDWREDYARNLAKRRWPYKDTWRNERALYEDIINERFLFKTFRIDAEIGLSFQAVDGKQVHCDDLSSGEQQLLVLYYQLLFEIEPDTLIMIDEPELSLNVVWQRNFLKDLQRIIELRKFDVLIATHSPEVIYDKWDWVVHLGEKVDD